MVKFVSAPTTETNGEAVDGAWEWLVRGNRHHDKALWTEPVSDVCHDLDMARIISLADACTPSLCTNIDGRCEEDFFANYS
ncbi:hypothetical protein AtEden1_Chr2g0227581 [Arabidopsis thaliana]